MNLYREDMKVLAQAVRPLRSMAEELRAAMDEPEQFRMRYQPIIKSQTNEVEFAKALLRWRSPLMGDVEPSRYIAVAEQNGLIRHLTQMVLRKVCEDLSNHRDIVVSANISPLDIVDRTFPDEVVELFAEFGIGPKQVVFECTEQVLPEDTEIAAKNIARMRQLGFAVATYDTDNSAASFGLVSMPSYTLLKIEKELLDEAFEEPQSRNGLQEAIDASHERGFKTLAVGVENEDQAKLVEQMGFDFQQGFFHSGSLSLEELLEFSSRTKEGPA